MHYALPLALKQMHKSQLQILNYTLQPLNIAGIWDHYQELHQWLRHVMNNKAISGNYSSQWFNLIYSTTSVLANAQESHVQDCLWNDESLKIDKEYVFWNAETFSITAYTWNWHSWLTLIHKVLQKCWTAKMHTHKHTCTYYIYKNRHAHTHALEVISNHTATNFKFGHICPHSCTTGIQEELSILVKEILVTKL